MGKNLTRKILEAHLAEGRLVAGEEIGIRIDQILAQDLTATQAFLHFEAMGIPRIRCRVAACYADHNVLHIKPENMEDHLYLQSASRKYGIWFGKPASGIGHQIHLEHFAVPGETVLGADSHTPHCGGVGMIAIGAGGMDVAVAMGGGPYYFAMPQVVGVKLAGTLQPWCTAKDVILELLRRLTVRGGKDRIFEFTGPGLRVLNAQQRVTITNMSYELGATTSIFPSDEITRDFFRRLGRARDWREMLPDADAEYDDMIDMDLAKIEPLIALPSLPDNVVPVRKVAGTKVEQVMVGSCTNGSYTDLQAVAKVMKGRRVHPEVYFFIHPSSRADLELLAREGYVTDLLAAGVDETLRGTVLIKVGDDISTDHIMPAGAEIVAYRSNIPRLAEFVFHRMDPEFSARAKARGGGFIVGGDNYGQGSSREHAALAPMHLGVRAVLAKSFSRIHHANLINWGIVPLIFTDPADYAPRDRDDEL